MGSHAAMPALLLLLLTADARLLQEADEDFLTTTRFGVRRIEALADVQTFEGNATHADEFRLLYFDQEHMLLGARNYLYDVSLTTLRERKRIIWFAAEHRRKQCIMRQHAPALCENFVRVALKKKDDELLVCGTNAFRPFCRTFVIKARSYQMIEEENGVAMCPYDPNHNSTGVWADGKLFSATRIHSARDSLIYSRPIRTEQHDSQWLNDPSFVKSFAYGDHVLFLFRETAVEHINCGKAVFSRVARICKKDKGGKRVLRNTWTTFFKARLNCSIPGEFPFYFNEIQAATDVGRGNYMPTLVASNRSDVIYAVFSTQRNAIPGSAVCAFRMRDVASAFTGRFKAQHSSYHNWLPVSDMNTPRPHPAQVCLNDSRQQTDARLNFVKRHTLMDLAVPAYGGAPVVAMTSFHFRLTHVAVDWQVRAADGRYYDVIFMGTDDGRVIKAINSGRGAAIHTVFIEDIQVHADKAAVREVLVHRGAGHEKLVVVGAQRVKAIPLHRCAIRTSCGACVALQDPYCSWQNGRCANSHRGKQSVETGRHPDCPFHVPINEPDQSTSSSSSTAPCTPCVTCVNAPTEASGRTTTTSHGSLPDRTYYADRRKEPISNQLSNVEPRDDANSNPIEPCVVAPVEHQKPGPFFNAKTLSIATVVSIVTSLLLGFVIGYSVSTRRLKRACCSETPYLDERLRKHNYEVPVVPYENVKAAKLPGAALPGAALPGAALPAYEVTLKDDAPQDGAYRGELPATPVKRAPSPQSPQYSCPGPPLFPPHPTSLPAALASAPAQHRLSGIVTSPHAGSYTPHPPHSPRDNNNTLGRTRDAPAMGVGDLLSGRGFPVTESGGFGMAPPPAEQAVNIVFNTLTKGGNKLPPSGADTKVHRSNKVYL